jgi:hypothetical protein
LQVIRQVVASQAADSEDGDRHPGLEVGDDEQNPSGKRRRAKPTKLVTEDGLDAVLVDPDTGEPVAWIPSPKTFGVPTTVVRARETLPEDAETRRNLSLTDGPVSSHRRPAREVWAAELAEAITAQNPRG